MWFFTALSLILYILLYNNIVDLLICTILLPAIGSLWVWLLPNVDFQKHRLHTLCITLITLLLSLVLWSSFDNSSAEMFSYVTKIEKSWRGSIWLSLQLGIDAISLWMILLTTVLFPICVLCSWNSFKKELMIILLLLETMLLAVWSILDLLGFYILYESVLIPMFLLIGIGGSRDRKVRAAYQLVLYTLLGSLIMLPCLLLIYAETGTTNLELLYHHQWSLERQYLLWWGFFAAFAVKIPMVPLHLWLPEAHVEASTAGSVLLAGVLLKLGTYGFIRFLLPLLPEACDFYSPLMLTLSLIALIYSSLTTLRQVDLKKIIAYSSVAHMNMVNMAIFCSNDLSSAAAIFLMISHGIVSPALFLLVGVIYDRYHTKLLRYLGGFANTMPLFSIFFFIFSLSNMALPLSPNFIAEFLTLCGVFSFHSWVALLSCSSMTLSGAYSLWAYARVVHGLPKTQYITHFADLCRREFYILLPLFLICIWLGLKPSLLLDSLSGSVFASHHLYV
jgi:proton-translocating NADH-quinone oxidoreductase chain M